MHKYKNIDENLLREYSPVVLAYIGDAVFELMVRTHVVAEGNRRVKDIHHATVERVKAESQARVIRKIWPELTEEEKDIVMRGRNAKTTPPKNADPGDYKMSTGFEALLGYLYLKGAEERLYYLVQRALDED
ncbi:ribonuclease-3 family protein [Thermosyntropha lipolytica DSM 11003]|uniref:Mini-ribonuclease 3 n=1 Tax=Thermosyntropha lipolytica DSM 11003 TaxID=1123382 RepID=A0A1M5NQZ7_9FIRM|nr:ribonuclease III domain-containing protein [Thermosyntropha lipolytica]SHG91981.1 ribonuclease-3 family protein [Thermosyntropha lipolytica DSM 11003]